MAVAIFVRGRALGLRRRAEPREVEGGAGTFTINELRVRIGQQAGRPPAGSAPWLPAAGVRAAPRGKRGRGPRAFPVAALRDGRFLIPFWPGLPFGRVRSGGSLGGVKDVVQRSRGSPGVHRMRAEKLGVTGSARVARGQENAGPSASRPEAPHGGAGKGLCATPACGRDHWFLDGRIQDPEPHTPFLLPWGSGSPDQ